MKEKDRIINNIFVFLLVGYGLIVNISLMLSMFISFIITLVLFGYLGLSDKDMIENTLMNKEPTEEMLEKYTSILRIMFIMFAVMTAVFYNWFMKCN